MWTDVIDGTATSGRVAAPLAALPVVRTVTAPARPYASVVTPLSVITPLTNTQRPAPAGLAASGAPTRVAASAARMTAGATTALGLLDFRPARPAQPVQERASAAPLGVTVSRDKLPTMLHTRSVTRDATTRHARLTATRDGVASTKDVAPSHALALLVAGLVAWHLLSSR